MNSYLELVKSHSELLSTSKDRRHSLLESEWNERLTPLENRLSKLLSGMPAHLIEQGLSLDTLRRLLSGKWKGNCHPGELGAALRRLGFVRKRSWKKGEDGFRSKWYQSLN